MGSNMYGVVPFDGKTNFVIWQQKIKCVLIQQKCYRAVTEIYLPGDDDAKKLDLNEKACSMIYLHLSDSVLRKVGIVESAKLLWDNLVKLYTDKSLTGKLFLLEKFFRFKLDLNKDIDWNLDVFTKLIQDIKLTGDKYIDNYTPVVLLNAIPDSYNDVKSAIKYGRDTITLDIVVNGLKSKELDLRQNGGGSSSSRGSDEVMHVRGRTENRSNYQKHDNNSKKNQGNGKRRSKSRKRKCYNCGDPNHFVKDCPKKNNEHANLAMGDVLMMCNDAFVNSVTSLSEHEWLIDSGCTFHMSPFRNLFSNYKEVSNGFVYLANEKNTKC